MDTSVFAAYHFIFEIHTNKKIYYDKFSVYVRPYIHILTNSSIPLGYVILKTNKLVNSRRDVVVTHSAVNREVLGSNL